MPRISPPRASRSTGGLLGRALQGPEAEARRQDLARLLGIEGRHLATDHGVDQGVLGVVAHRAALRELAVPQHGDPVADREHLLEPVRHIEDRDALPLELPDLVEQTVRLGLGQRGRRLVEDDHLDRVGRDDLRHLDQLLRRRGQPLDDHVGVDVVEPEGVEHEPAAVVQVARPDDPRARGQSTHEHVLADRQVRQQAELLVDGLHARGAEGRRGGGGHRGPVDLVVARVAGHGPGEDLDQGRLAGAVLARQAVHLPGDELERDAAEGLHGAVRLRDVRELQHGGAFGLADGHQSISAVWGSSSDLISGVSMLSRSATATPGSRLAGGMRPWVAIAASTTP
jgi:hypothetical protein